MTTLVLPYPLCKCGHRYDHHTDPGDPRDVGCWRCACHTYVPVAAGGTQSEDTQ